MSSDDPHLFDLWSDPGRSTERTGRHAVLGDEDVPASGTSTSAGRHRHPDDAASPGEVLPARGEARSPAGPPRRQGDRRRRRHRVGGVVTLVVLILIVAGLASGGVIGYQKLRQHLLTPDYTGSGSGSVTVVVAQGDTASDIASTLLAKGVVKSIKAFRTAAEGNPRSTSIQPGTYRLREHMKASIALTLLLSPASKLLLRFTIPEGYTVAQILARIAGDTGISQASLQAAAAKPATLGLPSWSGGRLEGFLFPATYDLQPGATATQALRAMTAKFSAEAEADGLVAQAAAVKMTPYQLLTIASIVEKEGIADDFSKIARVIYNRLSKPQRLQLDSTLNYALHEPTGHPTTAQTQTRSPYNTYLNAGLPPTPISNPGLTSLKAAGAPAAGPWLYFVTVSKDGHAYFTASYPDFVKHKQQAQLDGVY